MKEPYLAHSPGDTGVPQLLSDHLVAVAEIAAKQADKFGAGALARLAGLWHDIGKFNPAFQAYIRNPERSHGPDHSSAGAVLAAQYVDLLAPAIAGHHAGLADLQALKSRIAAKKTVREVQQAIETAKAEIPELVPRASAQDLLPPDMFEASRTSQEFFVRQLFSTLVDADFLDTERHFVPSASEHRQVLPSLKGLWAAFETDQEALLTAATGPMATMRAQIYQSCLTAAELPQGVFRLTVPTGGGKTRSGMAFALRHALRHGLDRVIVAIPYTSIIEQTVDVYRGIFGRSAVLEHHSAASAERPSPDETEKWLDLAAENWDAPIIVTTNVQLFESLFSNRPSRCRKLHNIARSVIVLDEVQTLPPKLLAPILDVLKDLVDRYAVSVVLSTATQPALAAGPYLEGFQGIHEIVASPERHFAAARRTSFETRHVATLAEIASDVRKCRQAMVVVNTKADAIVLLEAFGDVPALHLSALLCGAHRREVLKRVRRQLADDQPCVLIATQVVEAGVDLDFPIVYRALGPLDSLAQAAGRCNREGRRTTGRVVIFEAADARMPAGAYRTGAEIARVMLYDGKFDLHNPATYDDYFQRLFGVQNLDAYAIQSLRAGLQFEAVAARFRLIEDDTVPCVVRYCGPDPQMRPVDELIGLVRSMKKPPSWVFRELQPYLVTLRRRIASEHAKEGLLSQIAEGLWQWDGQYDMVRGIVAGGRSPEELIV